MFQYLKKRNTILNIEIEIILKLISINHIYLSIKALSCIGLHDEHPQFENILRLILEHVVNNRVVRTVFCCHIFHILVFTSNIFILVN